MTNEPTLMRKAVRYLPTAAALVDMTMTLGSIAGFSTLRRSLCWTYQSSNGLGRKDLPTAGTAMDPAY